MKFTTDRTGNYYLHDTQLSNIFIGEYMPAAPAEYVKVYLYAMMQTNAGNYVSNDNIAADLSMDVADVLKAWTYFEKVGVIRKLNEDETNSLIFDIEFTDLREMLFGEAKHETVRSHALDDDRVRELIENIERISGRTIPSGLHERLSESLRNGTPPELIEKAYAYVAESGKAVFSFGYIRSICESWMAKGAKTAADAEKILEEESGRYFAYRKVLNALGLNPEIIPDSEKRTIDSWLDDFGLSLDEILASADKAVGKSNKFAYVKRIIESDYEKAHGGELPGGISGKSGSESAKAPSRKTFYEKRRKEAEDTAAAHTEEVYTKLPAVKKLDDEVRRLNIEYVKASISGKGNSRSASAAIEKDIQHKTAEREKLLQSAGFDTDYTEIHYSCEKCNDTGVRDNGASCDCYIIA